MTRVVDWLLVAGVGLIIGSVLVLAVIYPPEAPTPYITISLLDLEFSEREYHLRVRDQIERLGFQVVCVDHLLTIDPVAKTYDVNRARMNLVLVTECEREEETFHAHEEGE